VRQLMLVWGVRPILSEEFTSIDAMIKAAIELTYKKGFIMPGDNVVIVAGAPSRSARETDFLRL